MTNYSLKLLASSLALAILSACGGGSSDAPAVAATGSNATATTTVVPVVTPSTPEGPLSKYVGTWVHKCEYDSNETLVLTATNNGITLSGNDKEEYFDNIGCTGAVIATSTTAAPQPLQYISTETNRSATLIDRNVADNLKLQATFTGNFDIISTVNGTPQYTGSGVSTKLVNGKTEVTITRSHGSSTRTIDPTSTERKIAVTIRNGELLMCKQLPGAVPSFECDWTYHR
jgi:hypothetical protein